MRLRRLVKVTFVGLVCAMCVVTALKYLLLSHMAHAALHKLLTQGGRDTAGRPLKAIYSYTKKFTPLITEARKELEHLNFSLDLAKEKRLHFANRTYSGEVSDLPNVRTVFLNVTKKMYLSALPSKWYDPHSNDCAMVMLYAKGYRDWKTRKCLKTSEYTHTDIHNLNVSSKSSRPVFRRGEIKNTEVDLDTLTVGYVHVIKDDVLLPIGDVITNDAHISIRGCPRSEGEENLQPNVTNLKIHDQIFSIAQVHGSNFYHFTAEDLSRLILMLPFLRQNKKVKIHVRVASPFVITFLRRLGLSRGRIVSGTARSRVLYLPGGTDCGRPAPFQTNLLSMQLTRRTQTTPRNAIILVRRSKKRWFKHHKAILSMLKDVAKEFGLRVEVFSDTSLPGYDVTARLFGRAVLVVAPHGAGLVNLVFSPPRTCVVEGLCYGDDGKVNLCYRDLSAILGHVYHSVVTSGQCMEMTSRLFRPQVVQCLKHVLQ